MSRTFGDTVRAQASATCAVVHPRRAATAATAGAWRTEPAPVPPEPSGENGTKAMPRRVHSSSTGWGVAVGGVEGVLHAGDVGYLQGEEQVLEAHVAET